MNVYITKYALTTGVICTNAEMVAASVGDKVYASSGRIFTADWVKTEPEARDRFEKMRKKRIALLERQITALNNMQYKEVKP